MSQQYGKSPRVWFITGTSSGIGRELTRAVVAHGDQVVAGARETSDIADLTALAPSQVRAVRVDVTEKECVHAAAAEAMDAFGRIDIVVNNAGYALLGAFEELPEREFNQSFAVNVFGALTVTRAVLPIFRRQRSGHIILISSVNGVMSEVSATAYCGAKFALEGIYEGIAAEVAHLGIRVLIVEPGPFRTDFSGRSAHWADPMQDYCEVIEPARREFEEMHGRQTGDPRRAAEVIIRSVGMEDQPLRLPLGAEAYGWIRARLRSRLEELDAVEVFGTDTAFR